jgi:hypothetical protein
LAQKRYKQLRYVGNKNFLRRAEQVLPRREKGRWWGKGIGAEYYKKRCTYVCKCRNKTCSNYSRNQDEGKGEWWRGEFKYDIFDTL